MGRYKIALSKEKIISLYLNKRLSPYKIATQFRCSPATIRNRLLEYNIPLKTKSASHNRYLKVNFSGDAVERAYLLGFRVGDLNVYRPSENSEILVVRCHTTKDDQVDLIKKALGRYGRITVSSTEKHSYHINCYLDHTFEFLLSKVPSVVEQHIGKARKSQIAFVAGYVDAEGHFTVKNQNRARFAITSYDYEILLMIARFLEEEGIRFKLRLIGWSGQPNHNRAKWNKDLWRLNINEARSLKKFTKLVLPYLKHNKRRKDARDALRNIDLRIKNGTVT